MVFHMRFAHALPWFLDVIVLGVSVSFASKPLTESFTSVLGLTLFFAGVFVMFYSKQWLGRQYSLAPRVKSDHVLVMSGPYALVRHPIYAGALLALLGLNVALESLGGLVAWLLIAIPGHVWRAWQEEKLLAQHFNTLFEDYCSRTGFMFPRVWRLFKRLFFLK